MATCVIESQHIYCLLYQERWAEERLAQAGAGVHAVPLHHVHRGRPPLQDQQVPSVTTNYILL